MEMLPRKSTRSLPVVLKVEMLVLALQQEILALEKLLLETMAASLLLLEPPTL
ncbi:hypothetical protein HDV03_000823, partial [Kappamyces sp. JEL0829]